MKADLIVKGKVYIGGSTNRIVELLAVKDGVVIYVGSSDKLADLKDKHTRIYEAKQGLVLPGLYEGHAHVCSGTDLFQGIALYGLQTPDAYLLTIKNHILEHPEQKFIIGRGFQNSDFGEMGPTASMLDELSTDKFIIMDSEDCHSSWVNSKVLSAAGIDKDTKERTNGIIVRNSVNMEPTGWLKEKEMDRVKELLPKNQVIDYKEAILAYQKMALSYGIVSCYEPILNDKGDLDLRIRAYHELDLEHHLVMQFRAGITIDPEEDIDQLLHKVLFYRKNYSGKQFQLQGIKVFIDGVIEGHTAFLREPYADSKKDRGNNMWQQDKLNELFTKAARKHIAIHVHAIGDGAIDSALDAFEEAYKETQNKDIRNCITHLQVVANDQFHRMKELGIIAVTNPFWHYKNPAYYHKLEMVYLGEERAKREYPLRSFFDHGIIVTQASDWPVSYSCHPLIGLETAITRRENGNAYMEPLNEAEAASLNQMLLALTYNGAYQMEEEQHRGSLEVGKKADIVILNQDLFMISSDEIAATEVVACFIDGQEVFKSSYNTVEIAHGETVEWH